MQSAEIFFACGALQVHHLFACGGPGPRDFFRPFFGARAALSVGARRLALVAGSWSSSPPRTRRRLVVVALAASPPLAAATARTAATVATSIIWRRCRRSWYVCRPLLAAATAARRPSSNGHRSLSASRVCHGRVSVNVSLTVTPGSGFIRPMSRAGHHGGAKNQRIPCFVPLKVHFFSDLQAHVRGPPGAKSVK